VIAVGAALFCAYETYTGLRDALFPGRSRLAREAVAEQFAALKERLRAEEASRSESAPDR